MKSERPTKNITLNAKGQLVIPKWLREQYGWKTGTVLALRPLAAGVMLQRVPPKTGKIEDLFGILKYDGPPKTLKDMDDAITEEVKARRASGQYEPPGALLRGGRSGSKRAGARPVHDQRHLDR